jgi:hypothetical protein
MSLAREFADFAIDEVQNFEDVELRIDELGDIICENMNANGSVFCDRRKTDEWIKQNWNDISDFIQSNGEVKSYVNFEEVFTEPERFMTQLATYCIVDIVNNCNFVREHSGETITLSDEDITTIIRDLEDVK